jgi:pimeloyl-ACP methyl ester carboxylesterase
MVRVSSMKICDIKTSKIAYEIYGEGETTIVIDVCLGSCSAEWWHIAKDLSKNFKMLVFDRAGYGTSTVSTLERTPKNVAAELNELLSKLNIKEKIILVGHSQGGLYSVQYALMYPEKVKGMVLVDPATPFDDEFKKSLTQDEYTSSGIDKTAGFKMGLTLSKIKLSFLFKPLLKKSPPFYYHKFEKEAETYMLKSATSLNTNKTALEEYKYSHDESSITNIKEAVANKGLKDMCIRIITHSSQVYVKELQQYVRLDQKTSEKIENKWQEIILKYMSLSSNTTSINAPNSGHFIHLTDYNVLKDAIYNLKI